MVACILVALGIYVLLYCYFPSFCVYAYAICVNMYV